jgi:septal ring factor EnvC (AmiA/AmiB activator)
MTELERMLKDSLMRMEQDFSTSLRNHGTTLAEQQRAVTAQSQNLKELQGEINRTNADLQTLMRRLNDLAELYTSLETLLSQLNGILSGNGR